MRSKIHIFLVAFVSLVAFAGCEHHLLYYSSSETVEVTINVDWSRSDIENPNGVTAIAYYDSGELYRQFSPFSNTSQIKLTLPEGIFDIVLYNNTNSEFEYINFEATSEFSTALVNTVSKTPSWELTGDDVGKDVVYDPDIFASCVVHDVEVTSGMVEYYYSKPDLYYATCDVEYDAEMLRRTVQVVVYADIDDICYAAGAPYTHFKHFAGGFLLGQEVADSRQVIQEFVLNNVVYDDETCQCGTIMKEFTSFGEVTDIGADYYVDINFMLLDGEYKRYIFDVTDQIEIEYNDAGIPYIYIYVDVTLPYSEADTPDDDDDDTSTGLGTDVTQWDNVGATLPL